RHRPRARQQPAHSHPRRGDFGARLRERADHPAQHAQHRQGPHGDHHRPPVGGRARLPPDRRHCRRAHRRSRHARRTAPPSRRPLCLSLGAAVSARGDSGGGARMTEAVRELTPVESTPTPAKRPLPPAIVTRAAPRRARLSPGHNLSDREFLAPVLEILETPPSPVRVAFLWFICVLVVVAIALAYIGRIDIIASAQGKFQPTGRVKVIEPVETGRVAAIHAANDSQVKAGDILVELDRSAAEADVKAAKNDLASALAEALRRQAELKAVWAREFSPPQAVAWPDRDHDAGEEIEPPAARMGEILPSRNRQQGVSRALRLRNGAATLVDIGQGLHAREERVLAANLGQLASIVASFDAQLVQKTTEREMLEKTIATQKNLVATLQERVDMRTKLVSLQSGAK